MSVIVTLKVILYLPYKFLLGKIDKIFLNKNEISYKNIFNFLIYGFFFRMSVLVSETNYFYHIYIDIYKIFTANAILKFRGKMCTIFYCLESQF
jgi:hypothetical protein